MAVNTGISKISFPEAIHFFSAAVFSKNDLPQKYFTKPGMNLRQNFILVFFDQMTDKQISLWITGFESRISGVTSDLSATCATTTAQE